MSDAAAGRASRGKRRCIAPAILAGLALLAGCGGSDDPAESTANRSWQGTWKSTWGLLRMKQRGATVTGRYTYRNGRLTGKADRRVLRGKWTETTTGAGSFRFEMSADGCTLRGKWDYAEIPGGGAWVGVRQTDGCRDKTP